MKAATNTVPVVEKKETRAESGSSHIYYYDYLRIFAAFFIVVIHVSSVSWEKTDVFSRRWEIYNIGDTLFRWASPVFVMISGSLLLNSDRPAKKILSKNVLKSTVTLFFWSIAYVLVDFCFTHVNVKTPFDLFRWIVLGHYHLWFMYMIIGLYLVTPFLRKIAENRPLAKYFLTLSFLILFLLPQTFSAIGYWFPDTGYVLNTMVNQMKVYSVLGYAGYFVLGHYLRHTTITKPAEYAIYSLGIVGGVVSVVVNSLLSKANNAPTGDYNYHFTVNTLCMAMAAYVFAKQHLNKEPKSERGREILKALSGATFGVYLIHPFFLELCVDVFHITPDFFSPFVAYPAVFLGVYLASLGTALILKKIPFVNKWIL